MSNFLVRVNMADFMDLKNDDDKKDSGKSESTDGDSRAQVRKNNVLKGSVYFSSNCLFLQTCYE